MTVSKEEKLALFSETDFDTYKIKVPAPPLTNYEKVREFHKAFGAALDADINDKALQELRLDLILEETVEVENELAPYKLEREVWDDPSSTKIIDLPVDKKKLAKELADLLYVTYGTAATFGIDIDRAFDEVHTSNMSKLGEDGKPVYREDGKVMKGPNYKPPTFDWITK